MPPLLLHGTIHATIFEAEKLHDGSLFDLCGLVHIIFQFLSNYTFISCHNLVFGHGLDLIVALHCVLQD